MALTMNSETTMDKIQIDHQILLQRVQNHHRQQGELSDLDLYALDLLQDTFCAIRRLSLSELSTEGKKFLYDMSNDAHNIPEYVGNFHMQRSWPNIVNDDLQQQSYESHLLRLYDAFHFSTSGANDQILLTKPTNIRFVSLRNTILWSVGSVVAGLIVGSSLVISIYL
jgi:hypothetical protein